ncbi:hypothetical protein PSA83_06429 (plasmid) [Pseudomonas aeruginosa]|nr:hypothetical protein PSA83_06429 [Pseudomonas aeruginosa]
MRGEVSLFNGKHGRRRRFFACRAGAQADIGNNWLVKVFFAVQANLSL